VRLSPDPAARRRLLWLALVAAAALVTGVAIGAGGGGSKSPPGDDAESASPPAGAPPPSPTAGLTLRQLVGQTLILRFEGTVPPTYVRDALRSREVAGAILFRDNVVAPEQVSALTDELQGAARGSALVSADQEGGEIRIFAFAAPEAAPPTLTDASLASRTARATAADLRDLGVNVNLAPIVDVPFGSGSVIASRAYPGDPSAVGDLVAAAVRGHADRDVAATAKHFPGLGAATQNTDDAPVTIEGDRGTLESDLEPFRAAIEEDVPLVMASHARYPAYDGERIASRSPVVLEQLLRDRLGFDGVIVTDSLEAEASLEGTNAPDAAVDSLDAGVDLVLMTGSGSYPAVFDAVLSEARRSPAFRARVEEAAGRVVALKERLGLRAPTGDRAP